MDKVGVAILGALGIVAVIVVLALFGAFTISTMWGWFITPFGVPAIGLAHSYGLGLFASLLMGTRGLNDSKGATNTLAMGLALNVICLLSGFITVQFM